MPSFACVSHILYVLLILIINELLTRAFQIHHSYLNASDIMLSRRKFANIYFCSNIIRIVMFVHLLPYTVHHIRIKRIQDTYVQNVCIIKLVTTSFWLQDKMACVHSVRLEKNASKVLCICSIVIYRLLQFHAKTCTAYMCVHT